MNSSRKILLISMILFFFSFALSSVNSDELPNSFRYLDENENETDNSTFYFDCSNDSGQLEKPCPFDHMDCITNNSRCKCKDEYTNLTNSDTYCNIKRKKQLTAFLLELFVGFGAGHFYRHHYLMASLKLVAFVFGIYVICLFPLTAKCVTDCCDSDCLVVLVSIIFYLYALGLAFWYIWDLVYFGKNKYKDCREDECVELLHW